MGNNHIITRQIGNLRGFSTDSLFLRPSNYATDAINLQRAPDGTFQLRRGYQCQIGKTGGMGIGTFDDPAIDVVNTVCVGTDGFLYKKLDKQIYLYYNGQITGNIVTVTNVGGLVNIESTAHGLQTGTQLLFHGVVGAPQLLTPNQSYNLNFFTITVVDANNFTLDPSVAYSSLSPAYSSGGYWSVYFADARYLTLTIFVDPFNIYSNTNQSINCSFLLNRAAQINGNQNLVNTINVQFPSTLIPGNVVQFMDINGIVQQRNVVGVSPTSISIDGAPVSVLSGFYINQYLLLSFGKGFDVTSPYSISDFIMDATSPTNGVAGLSIAVNGDTNVPAAFIQILEATIIPSGTIYTLDYWYWKQINFTVAPPLPGSANIVYQNSQAFENASMAAYDDVIYIANGWDFPQKYDGQTVYRTGLPQGGRPFPITDNTTYKSLPFVAMNTFQYAVTYEQIDARGHILEGQVSAITNYTVNAANAAANVTLTNLKASPKNNWNTNFALAVGGTSTSYGPDINGFYYDLVDVNPGFTLKIGDSAYYGDITAAEITGATTPSPGLKIPVTAGHSVLPGDTIYFFDSTNVERQRIVASIDTIANTITIEDEPVTVSAANPNILDYKTSLVFGNVAIIDGNQPTGSNPPSNIIKVLTGHTIQLNDVVEFVDAQNNLQRRNVTNVNGDGVHITVDQTPVSVTNLFLISSTNQRSNAINLQRTNANPATLSDGTTAPFVISNAISNNLRINIYRTMQGQTFGTNGEIFLVSSIPNDGSGAAVQVFIDGIPDGELGPELDEDPFLTPVPLPPNPPPISKYLKAFGNQMFYAGGERGNPENSDRVFFSGVSGITPNPEVVPQPANLFNVPNADDDITGIGVAGSTLVTTKNNSIWAASGNFLSGQIEVIQIAPGSNIGCVAHATIAAIGPLMYFTHTNGVYAITENQLFPTDSFGNPIPISLPIDQLFRESNYLPWTKLILKRAVACNYTKENQYLLFIPCEDTQSTIRTANTNSILLAYDHQEKNWFKWENMNAAGGIFVIDDDLYFQERRYSGVDGNTANLYKQHRFYRLVDHADHAGAERAFWTSSWEDLGQPEVRKKFCRCILLMDRLSELYQFNNPIMTFSTYLDRIPNLQSTIAVIDQVDNTRNAGWGTSAWGWNYWSGYQDSFININLKQGTVAKSIQIGFEIKGINMDIRLAGFQLEVIPENRKTVAR